MSKSAALRKLSYPKSVAAAIGKKPKKKGKKMKYPKVVEAALRYEQAGMALGYALLEECKDDKSVAEAHREMCDAGCKISESRCRELRIVASKFTPSEFRRINSSVTNPLAVSVFETARNAEELERIIDEAPDGQPITASYVEQKTGRRKPKEPQDEPSISAHSDALEMAERALSCVRTLRRKIDNHTLPKAATKHVVTVLITIADEARQAANAARSDGKDKSSHLTVA